MRYFSTVPPAMVGSEKERAEPSEGGWGTKGGLQYIEIKQLKKILKMYQGDCVKKCQEKKRTS